MRILEERLGASLFRRRGRGIALTEAGQRIAPQVAAAFKTLGDAFATVRADNAAILAITAPRTFATNWLAGRLGAFHRAHPELSVRLDVSDAIVDLAASEFDAAIRGTPAPPPGLTANFLMRIPVTPLASPAFLAAHPLAAVADLATVPRLSPEDEWWSFWFAAQPEIEMGARSSSGVRFDSQVLDGHAAIAGHGVGILSPPMFAPAIASGLLVQPFAHVATYRSSFWFVCPEHKRTAPKVRAFRAWLLDEVRRAAGGDAALLTPPDEPSYS
jgi:LysR family transcriptional regulator, glycine cleavage system transcriptional activator